VEANTRQKYQERHALSLLHQAIPIMDQFDSENLKSSDLQSQPTCSPEQNVNENPLAILVLQYRQHQKKREKEELQLRSKCMSCGLRKEPRSPERKRVTRHSIDNCGDHDRDGEWDRSRKREKMTRHAAHSGGKWGEVGIEGSAVLEEVKYCECTDGNEGM
jgi:hypothetical protein